MLEEKAKEQKIEAETPAPQKEDLFE